ncbi:probable phospholipid-transporting ATPase IA isoform X5 [Maniola hyperantus]|uniref:probable phospholipid-transporting ATPase IA isoform X5 n=2 Tax=Aphantopus hyperantus TaxID=2795564 RepID=UPI00156A31EB|nr:probable phospholipid-transporting ATPase IA isoform X3 [Maniola hyperantus]
MAFREYVSGLFTNHNVMAPFSRFYRAMVLKMNQHEDEVTTSGLTDGAADEQQNRVIFVNRPQPQKFVSNRISTAKYSLPSFVPLFLFEQFRRYSNCFFLLIALLQQIPDVSPTGRWTTLTPLILILTVSAIKEIVEDFKRHRADDETNRRKVEVLSDGRWLSIRWEKLQVGDICKVLNNQFFPADLVLLASSEPQGISFIETSNLDGETNLKIRQANPDTAPLDNAAALAEFRATVQCEPPNRHLYEFNGMLKETNTKTIPLGLEQMLLRGAMLRNTAWLIALVVYTGHETKLMKNSTKAPLKRSSIDKQTNTQILMLFIILLVLSLLSGIFNELWIQQRKHTDWYIGLSDAQNANFGFNFLTFLILYNNLIPISLQVTAEIVRFFQAKFIAMDSEMYHPETDTPALARTSNLNEELGMVRYVFSDKTGTLTCNVMEFRKCSIAEVIYNKPGPDERLEDTLLYQNLDNNHPSAAVISEFLTMLAVCHTVIPEMIDGRINYHAASPDERALVAGAAAWGWVFSTRTPTAVSVRARGHTLTYTVLHVLAFTSARKRMSVIVRAPTGEIKLYCKGADSVIYPRLAGGPHAAPYAEATLAHLEHFATEGLRTLVFAVADIPDHVYKDWSNTYHKASIAIQDREQKIEEAALLIENNLRLLGATAIEDKLQDGVPEAIAALLKANIHVWVLTGDKQETAINVAHSARLLHAAMPLLLLNEDSLDGTRESLSRHLADFGENLRKENEVALVIDGQTLKYAMGCDLKKDFLDLCVSCKVVVCCRVSPIQKAEVVEMVSRATGAVTLAIGDGANDVAMIQRASVGIGISGVEGLQAVCASDYSIAQFRFLVRLLLVHGAWNYSRISKLILYSFYKNICLYVIELWFAIYSAWSGQILFERWTIGFYNVIFTALPPFAIGLFDKICSPDIMLRHPVLYIPSQQGLLFNVRVFWVWAVNALLHSMLLFWLPVLLTQHHVLWPHGRDGGYLVLGNFVYTFVVATVCLKAGLATHSWTWVTHVSIWGSIALWFLFILVYSNMYPMILIGAVMRGMDRMVFSSLVFWFGLLLVPAAALLPDLVVTVIHNSAFKTMTEAVRESEIKKRDPAALLAQPRHSVFSSWTYLKCYVRGMTPFMCATDARHAVARLAQSSRRPRGCCTTSATCSGAAPPRAPPPSSSCHMDSHSLKRRAQACRRRTSSARTTPASRGRAPELTRARASSSRFAEPTETDPCRVEAMETRRARRSNTLLYNAPTTIIITLVAKLII